MPAKGTPRVSAGQIAVEAMDIANSALSKIAEHEQTCGARWAETSDKLESLRKAQQIHAKRWEKLAWMVGGCLLALTVASLT